jgi:hypothetical protein
MADSRAWLVARTSWAWSVVWPNRPATLSPRLSEVGPSRVPESGALLRVVEKLAPWESTPLAESLTGLVASSA